MGCKRSGKVARSGVSIPNSIDGAVLFTIPQIACEGDITIVKTSTGDIVYGKFGGERPSSKDYDFILTDAGVNPGPSFTLDAIIVGDVRLVSDTAAGTLCSGLCTYK